MKTLAPIYLIMFMAIACAQPTKTATPPPPQTAGPRIVLPDNFAVHVEVAADDPTREQGLMYRDQLAPDRGMIFIFPSPGRFPFWMKNTLIPLDMIWIDAAKKIVHIATSVPPCKADPCPSYDPGVNASYVLEVAGGVATQHHLAAGDSLRFEGLDNVVVR